MTSDRVEGIIVGIKGGFAEVDIGSEVLSCKLRGKLRLMDFGLVAGDKVEISMDRGSNAIEQTLKRRNFLFRPPVANVDCVAIFTPLATPSADLLLTDRLCILAEKQELSVIICATKADIADESILAAVRDHYAGAGYEVVGLSAPKGEGISRLRGFLKGKVSIFAGQSGAGKSTLINAILPGLMLKTAEVSAKIGRGKHTTRQVRLIGLGEGAYVADSPGFSSLELEGISSEELSGLMPDLERYRGMCRFKGCRHNAEPDCAVKIAVEEGTVNRLRYEHYLALLRECLAAEKNKYN